MCLPLPHETETALLQLVSDRSTSPLICSQVLTRESLFLLHCRPWPHSSSYRHRRTQTRHCCCAFRRWPPSTKHYPSGYRHRPTQTRHCCCAFRRWPPSTNHPSSYKHRRTQTRHCCCAFNRRSASTHTPNASSSFCRQLPLSRKLCSCLLA